METVRLVRSYSFDLEDKFRWAIDVLERLLGRLSLAGESDSDAAMPHKYGAGLPLPPTYCALDFSLSGLSIYGDALQWTL